MTSRPALVVAASLSLIATVACGSRVDRVESGAAGLAAIEWEQTSPSPLSPRTGPTIVWTGEEILVIGGTDFVCGEGASCEAPDEPKFSDGAAYRPSTDTWRPIADAPVGFTWSSSAVLDGVVYVSTAVEWTNEPALLQYRIETDTWRSLDPLPAPRGYWGLHHFVTTDDALIAYSTTDEVTAMPDLLFDQETSTWTELPDDPLGPAFDRSMVWDGSHVYLFDKALVDSPGGEDGPSFVRAARLDLDAGTWERLAESDILAAPHLVEGSQMISPVLGCVDGGQVNNYGRCVPFGGVFDTVTDVWTELPEAPGRGRRDVWSAGAIGSDVAAIYGLGLPAYDAATGTWLEMPSAGPGTGRRVESVGADAFVFGGIRSGGGGELLDDAWIWRSGRTPPAPQPTSTVPSDTATEAADSPPTARDLADADPWDGDCDRRSGADDGATARLSDAVRQPRSWWVVDAVEPGALGGTVRRLSIAAPVDVVDVHLFVRSLQSSDDDATELLLAAEPGLAAALERVPDRGQQVIVGVDVADDFIDLGIVIDEDGTAEFMVTCNALGLWTETLDDLAAAVLDDTACASEAELVGQIFGFGAKCDDGLTVEVLEGIETSG